MFIHTQSGNPKVYVHMYFLVLSVQVVCVLAPGHGSHLTPQAHAQQQSHVKTCTCVAHPPTHRIPNELCLKSFVPLEQGLVLRLQLGGSVEEFLLVSLTHGGQLPPTPSIRLKEELRRRKEALKEGGK